MAGFLESPTFYPGATSVTYGTPIAVRAGNTVEKMDFALQRSAGVKVHGTVTRDPRAQVFSDQLRVLLSLPQNPFFMESPVAADGSFEFARVPSGNYSARVYPGSIDYSSEAIEVKDKDIENLQLSVPYTVNMKARLLVEGLVPRIALTFTNAAGVTFKPSPLPNLFRAASTVGEELTIPIPEGDYRVAIAQIPDGFELKSMVQGTIDLLNERLKITAGSSPEIAITMTPKSQSPWVKVSGRVAGTVPSGSVRVLLTGAALFANLDVPLKDDGTFEFPQVVAGAYYVRLNPNLAGTTPLAVTVAARDINDVVFSIPRTREVHGRLTPENGSPAPQVQLALNSPGNNAFIPLRMRPTIQADGTFTVTLPEGAYDLAVEDLPAGYRIKSLMYGTTDVLRDRRIKIAAEDSSDLLVTSDFTSPSPWVKLSGRVVGTTASKVILVGSGPMRPAPPEASLNPDGSFEFPRVAPGQYMVRLFPPVEGALDKSLTVADRDIQGFELIVPVVRTVSLQAEMEGNTPLPRLHLGFVRTKTTGTYNPYPRRGADGNFQMIFAEGEYRFNSADLPANYRILSLTYGTVDLLKQPLVIGPDVRTIHVKYGLVSPISRVRVSGTVSGVENLGPDRGRVVLRGVASGQSPATFLDQSGNFSIADVPSGSYEIQALPGFSSPTSFISVKRPGEFVSSPSQMPSSNVVSVSIADKDVDGIRLVVPVTQSIPGRVVYAAKTPAITVFTLTLTNAVGTFTTYVRPDADGKFVVVFSEGEYKVGIENLPADVKLQSVRRGLADLAKDRLRIAGSNSDELQIAVSSTNR